MTTTAGQGGTLRRAAAVVLVRDGPAGQEIFWVRRSAEAASAGGVYAFPGGCVDEADRELADGDGDEAVARVAALRELFEETGVLLSRPAAAPGEGLPRLRRALLRGACTFAGALRELGVRADLAALEPAGRWRTPSFLRRRFDARFFVARLPRGQAAEVWPGELVAGAWTTPRRALQAWVAGDALLHPPALHLVRSLDAAPWPDCAASLREPPPLVRDHVAQVIEMQAGVRLLPLRTPTLPPATHTHCYVVGGQELLVIDPATPDPEEQQRLFEVCAALAGEGRRVREILLTHEHADHVGATAALRRRLGVPVRAHAVAAERLRDQFPIDGPIEDGERLALAGPPGQTWRAVYTPGHARGHLCFFEETSRALVAGDMLAGEGTVVVPPPPEGDMADYQASLERLLRLDPRAIYPAHGPVIVDGPARIQLYIAHRGQRERAVTKALAASGRARPEELVPSVYTDVPESMHALAAYSLRAVLDKLVKEARAERGDDGRYALVG